MRADVSADAAAHGEPDDRARPGSDLCADRRAHALAVGCAHLEAQLHPDFCAFGTAERAAVVEADVRTDVKTNDASLRQADSVERAPLNIVCLVSPHPTHPTRPSLNSPPSRPPRCNTGSL